MFRLGGKRSWKVARTGPGPRTFLKSRTDSDQDQICKKRTNPVQDQLNFSNHGPAHNFVCNVLFCFQSIFLCFQSIFFCFQHKLSNINFSTKSLFKFKLLQKWFLGIVARLDRFHEKLLGHAIFKWGPVTEKFSNWEFSFFSFLISTVEVTFLQIWANLERKKSYF